MKLDIKSNGHALGIARAEWQGALATAQPDPVVQIRHAVINGDENYRTHVAAIPERVGCHFHAHGNEDYAVVEGSGTLYWGKVEQAAGEYSVQWEAPVDVDTGDSFIIPEGYAHQLRKRGDTPLVIVFGCPDSHLDDTQDRTMLPDPPAVLSL